MTARVILMVAVIWLQMPAHAALPPMEAVGYDQHLGERVLLNSALRDESGAQVKLGDYFAHPVILQLGYFECPNLCSITLNSLVASLRAIDFDAGEAFEVVAVSIDPRETPVLAASKKAAYTAEYRRGGRRGEHESGWHFLTGDKTVIQQLAHSVGFRYVYDPQLAQFVHPAGIVILTPAGEISRYFPGVEYSPQDLRLALVAASSGKIGSLADRVRLLCSGFDPTLGRYSMTIMNVLRVLSAAMLLALTGWFAVLVRRKETGR